MAYTFSKIATVTVGSGGVSSIDFLAIPQNYTDLKIVLSTRQSGGASTFISGLITFNGATTNYSDILLYGNGASAGSASSTPAYIDFSAYSSNANATASTFGNSEFYIPNYAGSNNKSLSADGVSENNATTSVAALTAGLWSNTAAITQITITAAASGTFAQYSTAYLYGIKAEV